MTYIIALQFNKILKYINLPFLLIVKSVAFILRTGSEVMDILPTEIIFILLENPVILLSLIGVRIFRLFA